MKQDNEYYFYHNDHLGTPQKMTSVNGAVVWSAKYESFGKADVDPDSTAINNLRFPGQYFDAETGLHYNWHRYYDSNTGRYLRIDPIGSMRSDQKYTYCNNNTNKYTDSRGLFYDFDPATGIPNDIIDEINWIQRRIQNTIDSAIQKVPCFTCDYSAITTCVLGSPSTGVDCSECIAGFRTCLRLKDAKAIALCMAPVANQCFNCAISVGSSIPNCIEQHCETGHLDPCTLKCRPD